MLTLRPFRYISINIKPTDMSSKQLLKSIYVLVTTSKRSLKILQLGGYLPFSIKRPHNKICNNFKLLVCKSLYLSSLLFQIEIPNQKNDILAIAVVFDSLQCTYIVFASPTCVFLFFLRVHHMNYICI